MIMGRRHSEPGATMTDYDTLAQRLLGCEARERRMHLWCETHEEPWPCPRADEVADEVREAVAGEHRRLARAEARLDAVRALLDHAEPHQRVVALERGEFVQDGSPCVDVDAVRDALEGGERDPDSEAVDALLRQVAADAWDEGYRLDWTGGVKHINPYRTGADQ